MPEFGDELIIESYRVPWLIWIQLIVTVLLIIILIFGFSIFISDPTSSSSASFPSTGGSSSAGPPPNLNESRSSQKRIQVRELIIRRDEETRTESMTEEDGSEEDSVLVRVFQFPNHPCNYFSVAKRAFFKCFGLDSRSEPS